MLTEYLHLLLLYNIDKNTCENNLPEEGFILVHGFRGSMMALLRELRQRASWQLECGGVPSAQGSRKLRVVVG